MPVLMIAAISGFLAVALGAFGAHGLKGKLSADALGWWETATLYALTHAAIMGAVGLTKPTGILVIAGILFGVGIFIFSGSLYAMALGAPRFLGAITPIGGLAFLAGWAVLFWYAVSMGQL